MSHQADEADLALMLSFLKNQVSDPDIVQNFQPGGCLFAIADGNADNIFNILDYSGFAEILTKNICPFEFTTNAGGACADDGRTPPVFEIASLDCFTTGDVNKDGTLNTLDIQQMLQVRGEEERGICEPWPSSSSQHAYAFRSNSRVRRP